MKTVNCDQTSLDQIVIVAVSGSQGEFHRVGTLNIRLSVSVELLVDNILVLPMLLCQKFLNCGFNNRLRVFHKISEQFYTVL